MPKSAIHVFTCPIDDLPLNESGNSLTCEKGHTFDRAHEGYWNLLLVQNKSSSDPGDNKEMVAARKRFLNAGHYQPIANEIAQSILSIRLEKSKAQAPFTILDTGCGEGYYLEQMHTLLKKNALDENAILAGIDISKWAVKAAAKRSKQIAWAVASNRKLPVPKNKIELILSIFGFPHWSSFKQTQPNNGRILLVDPGSDHLRELREIIYPSVKSTGTVTVAEALAEGYKLESEKKLNFNFTLNSKAEIQDLLMMTPHGYRISTEGKLAIGAISDLNVTADIVIRVLTLTKESKH